MLVEVSTTAAYTSPNPSSQAIQHGDTLYVSGQVPKDPETREVVEGDIRVQTAQVFRNLEAVLVAGGTSLDNLVKTTVFLRDRADYVAFNEAYRGFVTEPYPARTTVQAGDLAIDALVEIDAIAAIPG